MAAKSTSATWSTDARGKRLGWLDRFGRPVLEFEPRAYQLGDEVAYYDRFGERLGALTYTTDAITS